MDGQIKVLVVSDDVRDDVKWIEKIWSSCLQKSGGLFLFGDSTNIEAMFAPVKNKLEVYKFGNADCVVRHAATIKLLWRDGNGKKLLKSINSEPGHVIRIDFNKSAC